MDINPIYPGGTQLQEFGVPFDADTIEEAIVTYVQDGVGIVLEKSVSTFSDAEEEGNATFSYRLTQEESLLFRNHSKCKMQVNLLMKDGTRQPSATWEVDCAEQFHRAVMT